MSELVLRSRLDSLERGWPQLARFDPRCGVPMNAMAAVLARMSLTCCCAEPRETRRACMCVCVCMRISRVARREGLRLFTRLLYYKPSETVRDEDEWTEILLVRSDGGCNDES